MEAINWPGWPINIGRWQPGKVQTNIKAEVEKSILSGESGVKISLVLTLMGLTAGGFAFWIWWAATVSTKLDNIILQQSVASTQQTKLMSDVEELKAWRNMVDKNGSATAQSIGDRVRELEKKFELHEARTTKP